MIVNTQFRYITKAVNYIVDPYEDILAPLFRSSWIVESWGRPYKADVCNSTYSIINNEQVTYVTPSKNTEDHSKWAVSADIGGLICMSGLNHMSSQRNRGGSFICFNHGVLYNTLKYKIMSPT